jgi:hypothetical protein
VKVEKVAKNWEKGQNSQPLSPDDILPIGNPLMTGPFSSLGKDGDQIKGLKVDKSKSIFGLLTNKPTFSAIDPGQFVSGKWMCAFDQLHFADDSLESYSCKITEEAIVAYCPVGFVFLFTGVFALGQILEAGTKHMMNKRQAPTVRRISFRVLFSFFRHGYSTPMRRPISIKYDISTPNGRRHQTRPSTNS